MRSLQWLPYSISRFCDYTTTKSQTRPKNERLSRRLLRRFFLWRNVSTGNSRTTIHHGQEPSNGHGGPSMINGPSVSRVSPEQQNKTALLSIEQKSVHRPNQKAREQYCCSFACRKSMAISLPTASSWWLAVEERRKTRNSPSRNKWLALVIGQVVALVAASMNAASFTLTHHNKANTQLSQLFIMYALLSSHLLLRDEKISSEGMYQIPYTRIRLQIPWWTYLMISILDIIPNFMALVSFRYTSLTSMTLLGSLTVPSTMFFSGRILSRVFCRYHYLGVFFCVVGGCLTVWADFDSENYLHSYIGDMLAVLAALIYGLGDVMSEYCVKNVDRYELLGMLGLYGSIITGFCFPWVEGPALVEIVQHRSSSDQWEIAGVLTWYITSVLLYYVTEAFFLIASDATLLNLSMQSSNLWAILFSFAVYHILPPLLFYPALVLVVGGVCIYELKPRTSHSEEKEAEPLPPRQNKEYSYSYASIEYSEEATVQLL